MKKRYLQIIGSLIITWILVQSINVFLIYREQNIFDLSPLKEWIPWAMTFISFLLYFLVKEWLNRSK